MPADLYRDPYIGIRARLAELRARIRDREAEVTPAFWESLREDVRDRLREAREAIDLEEAASLEALARAEGLLASYVDELDRLIARLPTLEAEWHELPDDVATPPLVESWAWSQGPSDEEWDSFMRRFESTVRDRDREAAVASDGRHTLVARFRDHSSPFALRATAYSTGNGQIGEVAMWLVTSVPRAMPRLHVRHETLVLALGKVLGLKSEVEVGEPSFDGLFLIEGAKEAVRRLLPPSVRAQLLALSRFDIPTLEIHPSERVASLRWRFEPAAKALDAAVRVLASIRELTPGVRFRNE